MLEKDLCDPPTEECDYIAIFRETPTSEDWRVGQVCFYQGMFQCELYDRSPYPVQVKAWLPMPKIEDFKCS